MSPSWVERHAETLVSNGVRTWDYFWSMVIGAAPFLTLGGVLGALLPYAPRHGPMWTVVVSLCLPACDCTISALGDAFAGLPKAFAGFALMWTCCCNPLALWATAVVLGPRMLALRMLCGAIASLLAALAWWCIRGTVRGHGCGLHASFCSRFVRNSARGLTAFTFAAGFAAIVLAAGIHNLGSSGVTAALAGSLLSPCSSADPLLARVLFARPSCELAFVVAAQCVDVRQFLVARATFGNARAICASAAGAVACAAGYAIAGTNA